MKKKLKQWCTTISTILRDHRGRDRTVVGPMQSVSITTKVVLWVRIPLVAKCTRYIMWLSLSVSYDRSVIFSGYYGFIHQYNRPARYNWNFVESGVKHHTPSPPPMSTERTSDLKSWHIPKEIQVLAWNPSW